MTTGRSGRRLKLTIEQAAELRQLYAQRRALPPLKVLAADLGISVREAYRRIARPDAEPRAGLASEVCRRLADHHAQYARTPSLAGLAKRYGLSVTAARWYAQGLHKGLPRGDL
jgi:hypothetical protein